MRVSASVVHLQFALTLEERTCIVRNYYRAVLPWPCSTFQEGEMVLQTKDTTDYRGTAISRFLTHAFL